MLETLFVILKIVFIVFFFGFCVFIHEFGHLIVALWQGLHVEKFSIGMGPKIWGFHWRGVEFVVSWLPFGGYVALPQLDPTDHPETSDKKPLPFAGPRQRALTAFAGPLFNVHFGFLLALVMWGVGLWGPAKSAAVVVDAVPAFLPIATKDLPEDARLQKLDGAPIPEHEGKPVESLYALALFWDQLYPDTQPLPKTLKLTFTDAKGEEKTADFTPEANPEWIAGLRAGDRIIAVNGHPFTGGLDEFQKEYVYSETRFLSLANIRDGQQQLLTYTPAPNPDMENLGYPFFSAGNPLQTGAVTPGSPAALAGLAAHDQLLALEDTNIQGVRHFGKLLREHAGETVVLTIARDGKNRQLAPIDIPAGNPTEAAIGIAFQVLAVSVIPGYPAAAAGLRNGDQIIRFEQLDADGKTVLETLDIIEPNAFVKAVRASDGRPVRITYLRGGQEGTATMHPARNTAQSGAPWQVGIILADAPLKVITHPNPWTQFSDVMGTTCRTLGLLFRPITSRIGSLFSGKPRDLPRARVGVQHMSGPVGILLMLWYKLRDEGFRGGFAFIILITFSLAFMNLLPLPVLDGGHILFAAIEAVTRRRMPAKLFTYVYNLFAILLIGLMIFITFFDGKRIYRITTQNPAEKKLQKSQEKTNDAATSAAELPATTSAPSENP